MVKTKFIKSAGRFGPRYGQHIKRKITDIEGKQRRKQICPVCNGKAKRISKGIWKCKKCKRKFAAHAYFLEKGAIDIKIDKEAEKQEKQKPVAKKKLTEKSKTKKPKKKKEPKNKKA